MKLYSTKMLRTYAKDIYFEHNPSVGRDFKRCYHYDIKETGRALEAIKAGCKPVDITQGGAGCEP